MSSETIKKRRAKWRGKKGELSLVKIFEDYGYKARRSVLSGIGRSLPDVEATKGDTHIVVECIPKNAIVFSTIPKMVEELQRGDPIVTCDGILSTILDVFKRQYQGDLISITPWYTNIPILLTPEHPVLAIECKPCIIKSVRSKGVLCIPSCNQKYICGKKQKPYDLYKLSWVKAKDLTKKHALVYPRIITEQPPKEISLYKDSIMMDIDGKIILVKNKETIKVPIKPSLMRLLGYYLSEGYYDNYSVKFAFSTKEIELHNDLKDLMKEYLGLYPRKPYIKEGPRGGSIVLGFGSQIATAFFDGIIGKGARNKKLPWWVITLPEEYLKELIKGYYLGDGLSSFGKKNYHQFSVATASKFLAYQMRLILHKLGIMHSLEIRNNPNPVYKINIGGQSLDQMSKIIGINHPHLSIRKIVKRPKGWVDNKYVFVMIKHINKIPYNGEVYNFEVDNNPTYTVHGIIVHNCKAARTPFVKIKLKQIGKLKDSLDFYDYYPNKIALVAVKFHYGGHYYPYEFFRIPDDRLNEIHKVYSDLMAKLKDVNDKRERNKIKSELNRTVLVIRAGEKGDWRPL
jgi:intein/homing endonuclease